MIVGRLIEEKITVEKQGFTTRPSPGSGTRLSFGLILHNSSPSKDATAVTVQTNFVMGDNNLLGTDTERVDEIAAGSDFALGRMINFPGLAPITRLEVVVTVGSFKPHVAHQATLANMHLVPQIFDSKWLGSVEGELQNTDPAWTLQSASLSAVVFYASGNVLGGGSGFAFQSLLPGCARVRPALQRFRSHPDGQGVVDDGLRHVELAAARRVEAHPGGHSAYLTTRAAVWHGRPDNRSSMGLELREAV